MCVCVCLAVWCGVVCVCVCVVLRGVSSVCVNPCVQWIMRVLVFPFSPVSDVSNLSRSLHDNSKKWHWGAKKLNLMEWWKKYMPIVVVLLIILFLLYYFVF